MSQPKQRVKENLPDFKIKIDHSGDHIQFLYDGEYDEESEQSAKITEFMVPVLTFIHEHDECERSDIMRAFAGKVGGKAITEILKRLETDTEISVSGRPKKYRSKQSSDEILDQTDTETPQGDVNESLI